MDKRIKNLVEMYFDDIPYSEEVMQAQQKIETALNEKFEKMLVDKSKDEALEEIVGKYSKLSDMAELAGYQAEAVTKWRSIGEAKELKSLKKEIRKLQWRIYGISLLSVAFFVELLWLVYYLFRGSLQTVFILIFLAIIVGGTFLIYRKYKHLEKEYQAEKYDTKAYIYLCELSERYAKRRLNGIALFFAMVTIFILSELSFYFSGNSKSAEFVENFFANIIFIEVPLYICIKNRLFFRMLQRKINHLNKFAYKKHLLGITIFSTAYWLAVTAVTFIFQKNLHYPANVFIMAGILFALLVLMYNLILRKKVICNNIAINKRRITVFTVVVVCVLSYLSLQRDTWYTQPYINSVPVIEHNEHKIDYNDKTGVYTITSSTKDFKILHLTDIHLGGSLYSYRKDIKALKACYAEIKHTKPDLVVVTGDLTFPMGIMSMSLNNSAPVNQFAAFMRNLDIPWCFTYGNHDTESLATTSKSDLNELYKSLSYKTSGNLLYPYMQPAVMGRNNQLIEVRNSDGTLNTALFLIDSNAYTGEGINVYDYIHDDQVDWYANEVKRLNMEEGHTISSLVFFHIPLQQYRTAYELYESGSDEVKYFFGKNGEKMINKVCCSDYPSNLFDRMLELGSTKGVFCGHDHYNNMSLEYKGIRLTYGMSIDYLAMPGIENDTEQRGGELITLHADSSWDLKQIPLTSITE
ncbi:MAG: hypothetical protein HFJ09_15140 [Lachnospiraceae bacterium]|nr:hypothetical protein [Lachnospiraceae bacterium]